MKRPRLNYLTFLAVALFNTHPLSAQNLELGLNYGIGYNGTIKNTFPGTDIVSPEPEPRAQSPVYSVKGIYTYNKWQFGLSVNYSRSSYKAEEGNCCTTIEYYSPSGVTPAPPVYLYRSNASYIPVKLLVNRKILIHRFEIYGGLSAGYIFIPTMQKYYYETQGQSFSDIAGNRNPFNKNGYYGLNAGLQIGNTYFITKHFGVNAELSGDYIKFKQGPSITSYTYTFPAVLGIRYKL